MKKKIMICVTDQKVCEELIVNTINHYKNYELDLNIIHGSRVGVVSTKESIEALEYLFEVASNYGAGISVLKTDNILKTLTEYAIVNNIDIVIMGETRQSNIQNSIIPKMEETLKDTGIEIKILPTIIKGE